jgi:hypothetical protein
MHAMVTLASHLTPSVFRCMGAMGPWPLITEFSMVTAADSIGSFSQKQFVLGVLQELRVALCCCHAWIEQADTFAGYSALAAGWAFVPDMAQLVVEA